jgi:flagellar basal body-associated protein FliL
MKLLAPLAIALVGLGVGVGAGVALKPAPEEAEASACPDGEDCEAAADPFAPAPEAEAKDAEPAAVVAIDKPFVVPVFSGEEVVAMVVASVAVEIAAAQETEVEAATPRLRDAFLAAMFRHANSGGFDGAFTTGRKMEDLRAALLVAARQVFGEAPVSDVLITEIAKQDV